VTEATTLGIDLGIKHFATFSDGTKIDNLKPLKRGLKKLQVLQRRASRKMKGSENRKKANFSVALLHEKIANTRKDFLHKLTYQLTHENQVSALIIEDLNVAGMLKNHCLARSIADVSWSKFNEYLTYKCDWYGKNLLRIGRFEPSSKMCSSCGAINQYLTLGDRLWTCSMCNTTHDRDVNAAKNIKNMGLQNQNFIGQGLAVEPTELLIQRER